MATLYEIYQGQGKTLPNTVADRFADPAFATAAKAAGIDQSAYSINMGNAAMNTKIANLYGKTPTAPAPITTAPNAGSTTVPDGSGRPIVPTYTTPTTSPSSSQTGAQTNTINTSTGATTTTPEPLSDVQTWYMQQTGLNEADVRNLTDTAAKRAAVGSAFAQFNANKQELASGTEAENASWQSTLDKFNIGRQGSLEQAKSANYAANPYAATAGGVDFGADAINRKYDVAQTEAQAAHSAAMANLKAGNMKAAAANLKTVDDIINNVTQQSITNEQNKAILANTQAYQAQTIQNLNTDNFRSNLTSINYSPDQINEMEKSGKIYSDPTFISGIKSMAAEYLADPEKTSQAVIDTMRTGSIAKQKAEQAEIDKQKAYNLALVKASQAQQRIDLTDRGTAISGIPDKMIQDIYANASTGVPSDKIVVANANKIAEYVASGNLYDAKKLIITTALTGMGAADKTAVVQKQATIDELEALKLAYQEYSKTGNDNIITANMKKFANYLGINVDSAFTKNDVFKLMVQQIYRKSLTGAQFSEKEATEYEKIFPQGKDSNSLRIDKIDAVLGSTKMSVKAVYDAEMGPGNFDRLNTIMAPTVNQVQTGTTGGTTGGSTYKGYVLPF